MDTVPWNRVILEEFCSLAILTPLEEQILRTRAAGWSQALRHLRSVFAPKFSI